MRNNLYGIDSIWSASSFIQNYICTLANYAQFSIQNEQPDFTRATYKAQHQFYILKKYFFSIFSKLQTFLLSHIFLAHFGELQRHCEL